MSRYCPYCDVTPVLSTCQYSQESFSALYTREIGKNAKTGQKLENCLPDSKCLFYLGQGRAV